MCGIAGLVDFSRSTPQDSLRGIALAMGERLAHRGPDDSGVWLDTECGIALAHRRLSIIDISPAGHQPMCSRNGRYVIVYNGEIYNFESIRRELVREHDSDVPWRGHSDTEVLLEAIAHWGIEKTLLKCIGMFAFALWDRQTKTMTLARDRMGEKPLYYGILGKTLIFSSELKALRAYPGWRGEIDRSVIPLFLRHCYVPAPHSIYKGIYKLWPGTAIHIKRVCDLSPFPNDYSPAGAETASVRPISYWSFDEVATKGVENPFKGDEKDAVNALESLITESVKGQMVADVPLGAFLSGGIDSSTIVALMQANSSRPVKTFCIGFYEPSYNEAVYAREVARHLKTDHTELYVSEKDALQTVQDMPAIFDEPFSDASQVPTCILSKLTRSHVTVSLSGDGGDELLGGYMRYAACRKLWKNINWLPAAVRTPISRMLRLTPESVFNATMFWLLPVLHRYGSTANNVGQSIHRIAELVGFQDTAAFYQNNMSHWQHPLGVMSRDSLPSGTREAPYLFGGLPMSHKKLHKTDMLHEMMMLDMKSYLPDDILVKVDRASMAASLESRIPLLDHRIVEFAFSLPVNHIFRNGTGKQVLRSVLDRYVPRRLVERPKMGFGIPMEKWLRGDLRPWAESLLDEGRLKQEGFLNPQPVLEKWREHLSGRYNWHYELWDILMFQAWLGHERAS